MGDQLAQLMLDGRQSGPHGNLGLPVPVATVAAVVRVALGAGVDMKRLPGGIDSVSEDQVVTHVLACHHGKVRAHVLGGKLEQAGSLGGVVDSVAHEIPFG